MLPKVQYLRPRKWRLPAQESNSASTGARAGPASSLPISPLAPLEGACAPRLLCAPPPSAPSLWRHRLRSDPVVGAGPQPEIVHAAPPPLRRAPPAVGAGLGGRGLGVAHGVLGKAALSFRTTDLSLVEST